MATSRENHQALDTLIQLLNDSGPSDITRRTLNRLATLGLSTGKSHSFKARVVGMYDKHTAGYRNTSWYLDHTPVAFRFADLIGAPRPTANLNARPIAELLIDGPSVVKPESASNSRGIYLVHSATCIKSLKDETPLTSLEQLVEHATLSIANGNGPARNRWIVEQLVYHNSNTLSPARDVKVYCFYGRAELVQQIDRTGGLRVAHWDRYGHSAFPRVLKENVLEGRNFPVAAVELAEEISANIPHPFMRVDLLSTEHGPILGELTPRPGTYHHLTAEWDQYLGKAWTAAEERLQSDLLEGRSFFPFLQATRFLENSHQPKHPS